MVKHAMRKRKIFELTWLLDEETSTNSCSDAFFFEEVEGFVGAALGAATSAALS
jgi:hypothetical protein